MEENKVVTYSLLSHIRNTGTLIKGPLDAFVPLIKRVLSLMCKNGITKGKNINEIKIEADKIYSIDFPLPVIKNILYCIAREVNQNNSTNFEIFNDGGFIIKDYLFDEFEEFIDTSRKEINNLEDFFSKFCALNNRDIPDKKSIFDFIDKNKLNLSKYFTNKESGNGKDFSIEAKFINYFKNIPSVFDLIKNIYLGSIISGYLEYHTTDLKQNVELILDTNFIISLLDLNTPESTHTCKKLLDVCKNLGYKFFVAEITIEEIKNLLEMKAQNFNKSFLSNLINSEDIYNACERRKLTKSDLERISDNLLDEIKNFSIDIIWSTTKFQNIAKYSKEFEILKKYRNTEKSALHDATLIYFVKYKRGNKNIKRFEDVKCWFVNNSLSHESDFTKEYENQNKGFQPEIIKADELLNIIWLSNPNIKENPNDIADIGITSLVSITLNKMLPKASIIRELEDNFQKFKDKDITDKDIINISTRIVNREIQDVQELNDLAHNNDEMFVKRIKEESEKQNLENKEIRKLLEELSIEFQTAIEESKKTKNDFERKSYENENNLKDITSKFDEKDKKIKELSSTINNKNEEISKEKKNIIKLENELRRIHREEFINKKLKNWRLKTIIPLIIIIFIILIIALTIFMSAHWDFKVAKNIYTDNFAVYLIITFGLVLIDGYFLKILILKCHNSSNIKDFKKGITIPDELKEISE